MGLRVYARTSEGVVAVSDDPRQALVDGSALWIDLHAPLAPEEATVEAVIGVDIPTAAERGALEDSSLFYEEDGALALIPTVLARDAQGRLGRHPVAFVLTRGRLVTARDCSPRPFEVGEKRASARVREATCARDVLFALLEGLVERLSDLIHETSSHLDILSEATLARRRKVRLHQLLKDLGQAGRTIAKCRDSLASFGRMARFAQGVANRHDLDRQQLVNFAADVAALERQAEALNADLTFLLDAVLGMAEATQNDTLKVMAVVTLAFAPPTLVASAFGMNFEVMPLLSDPLGFWQAIGLMGLGSLAVLGIARLGRWI